MNSSAVPGMLRVDRDHEGVAADRDALRALLELVGVRVVDPVADVHDVAVPEVLDPGVAARHVRDRVDRESAQDRLQADEPVARRGELRLHDRVEVVAVAQVGRGEPSWIVVEHVDPPRRLRVGEVVPGAGHVVEQVGAVADPGDVERVRGPSAASRGRTRGRRSRRRCCRGSRACRAGSAAPARSGSASGRTPRSGR